MIKTNSFIAQQIKLGKNTLKQNIIQKIQKIHFHLKQDTYFTKIHLNKLSFLYKK